jgi:hypothetical protein
MSKYFYAKKRGGNITHQAQHGHSGLLLLTAAKNVRLVVKLICLVMHVITCCTGTTSLCITSHFTPIPMDADSYLDAASCLQEIAKRRRKYKYQ